MSKKVKKAFRIIVIAAPFLIILLDIFRNGFNETNFNTIFQLYTSVVNDSVLQPIFAFFYDIFGANPLVYTIYLSFIGLICFELMNILFELLMFIPNFVGGMFEKMRKVGVKDE